MIVENLCLDNQFFAPFLHAYLNRLVLEARDLDPNGADLAALKNMALDTLLRVSWPAGNA